MLTNRQLFFQHLAVPSNEPLALEIVKAEGIYMYDNENTRYVDLVSGVSVSNIGHRNSEVIDAIKKQLDDYMHLMVYGEIIQNPQVKLAEKLSQQLPKSLKSVYFVNSGSEAIEGALKLAKRFTGKSEVIAFKNAYHGGTHGALSILGNEELKYAFRPLLPDIRHLNYNSFDDLNQISSKTACVVIEPIQAEAGIILPRDGYLKALREKCDACDTVLIYDDIQMGFGRTGKLFSHEHEGIIPDILCLAKGMGGGMPIGAFISSKKMMFALTNNPALGHITTFGGHPVCCAAALANLDFILENKLSEKAEAKGQLFVELLQNLPNIKEIRGKGLMLAVEMKTAEQNNRMVELLLERHLIVDKFLFHDRAFRIAPPLIITEEEIKEIAISIKECILKVS